MPVCVVVLLSSMWRGEARALPVYCVPCALFFPECGVPEDERCSYVCVCCAWALFCLPAMVSGSLEEWRKVLVRGGQISQRVDCVACLCFVPVDQTAVEQTKQQNTSMYTSPAPLACCVCLAMHDAGTVPTRATTTDGGKWAPGSNTRNTHD